MEGCLLVYGLVSDNTRPGYARVKLPTYDDVVTDWLPVAKTRAMNDDENWPLEINEQVACVIDRYCVTGIILGAMSNDVDVPDSDAAIGKWRMKFSDGATIEYDKNAHLWRINNNAESMYQLLHDTLTVLTELIFDTPQGPTDPGPRNVTTPGPSGVSINNLLSRLGNFLQG